MSFGDGDLHEKCEMYRRQLGGVNAANNRKSAEIRRLRKRVAELESLVRDMASELRSLNDGGIPTDCMEHEQRIRELGIEVDDD